MSNEPLDVSLRVRLDYQAAGAKTAKADVDAIAAAATRLGGSPATGRLAGELSKVWSTAASARRDIDALANATSRLGSGVSGSDRLVRELGRITSAAKQAQAEIAAAWGATPARAAPVVSAQASGRMRASEWADKVKSGAIPNPYEVKAATREVEALAGAAGKLGHATGANRLAAEVGAIVAPAVEARRQLDTVRDAAHGAAREVGVLARAGGGLAGGGRGILAAAGAGGGGFEGGGGGSGGGRGAAAGAGGGMSPLGVAGLARVAGAGALSIVGGIAGYAGVEAVGRGIQAAERDAIDFEAAMVDVRRAVGDLPDAGIKRLEGSILGVSRATGSSAEGLAGLAAAATRAGRPLEDIPAFLERAAKSANVMGLGVGEVGGKLIELGRTWHENQTQIEDTTDAVALLAEKTGARAGGVLDFVNRQAGLRERGMSARQAAAFGAGFQASGLDPGQAQSAFAALADRLANPQRAGQDFEARLFNLGVGPTQARMGMRTDPTRTLVDVLERFKALPENRRGSILQQMFGPEGGEEIGRVVDHLDDLRRSLGLVEDAGQRSGALERSFKIFDETTRGKIDRMTASLEALGIKLGSVFSPSVGAAAERIANAIDGLVGVLDRVQRAYAAADIIDAKRAGKPLTKDQEAAIGADPQLKAMVGEPGAKLPPLSPSLVPQPPVPRSDTQPELTDPEVTGARARAREQLEGRVRELEQQKSVGAGGPDIDRELEAARRRREKFDDAVRPRSERHGALEGNGLFVPAAYRTGDDFGGSSGLEAIIAAGTKAGVIAGLRDVLDLRAGEGRGSGGIVQASYEGGDLGGGADGGGGGGEGGSDGPRPTNLRYGPGGRTPRRGRGAAAGAGGGHPGGRRGRSSGASAGGSDGAFNSRVPERPGTYRPQYKLSDADLDDRVINTIAGEARTSNPEGVDAVINNMLNRVGSKGWGPSRNLLDVARAPGQYAGYRRASAKEAAFIGARIRAIASGGVPDNTHGSNAYRADYYHGPWYRKHAGSAVSIGGNRFAYEAGTPNGPYAPYRDPHVAPAVAEDRSTRSRAGDVASIRRSAEQTFAADPARRQEAARRLDAPHETVSPRFSSGRRLSVQNETGSGQGRLQVASAEAAPSHITQNFYGQHDPAETARRSQLEQNREVCRSQARALHSVGRVA